MDFPDENLIEEVRAHKCLYDLKDPNYKNVYVKDKIWTTIAVSLNVDAGACKKRWKNLRDVHRRCVRQNILPSGSGAPIPKKPWKYASAMDFLRGVEQTRSTTSNVEISYSSSTSSTPVPVPAMSPLSVPVSPSPSSTPVPAMSPLSVPVSPSPSSTPVPAMSPLSVPVSPSPSSTPVPVPAMWPLYVPVSQSPSSTPVTAMSPMSAPSSSSRKRKRNPGDDEFVDFVKTTAENIGTMTKTFSEKVASSQQPIMKYFCGLAQEVINADLPPYVQRAIFESAQKAAYSIMENYE